MSIKLLCFSDLHLTNRNPKFKITNGISDLLTRQSQFVHWLVDKYHEEEYDFLLFLGDWTDYPTLDPVTQTVSSELLARIIAETNCVLIEGNHCISDTKGLHTVLGAVKPYIEMLHEDESDNILVTSNSQILSSDGMVAFHCFPYASNFPKLEAAIARANEELDTDIYNIMLFHFPTTNAVLDNQLQSKKGVALLDEIICNFDIVIGGDFHRPQQLLGAENAFYVGAPFDFNYGDHVEERGAMSVEFDDEGDIIVDMIENPFRPHIRKITAEEAIKLTKQELENNVYRVVGEDVDPDIRAQLQEMRETAYRMDLSVRKKSDFVLSADVKVIESIDPRSDVDVLTEAVSEHSRADKLIKIFKDVRLKCM